MSNLLFFYLLGLPFFFFLPILKGRGNQGGIREVYYQTINLVENLVGSNISFLEKVKLIKEMCISMNVTEKWDLDRKDISKG